ncbi:MAG: deoxyribonuclease IV [Bryobacterales bacterium]|nr:deoxyribonuclease IV [Bryobacterales bacterium]MBV9402068.1 deoxyribonuclease IV [Bryobacterales bacterium]
MRIGIHTSISGSLERAALKAAELGANTFQIFSSSPRQWKPSTLSVPAIKLLQRAREKHDLYPLAIHDNYLINLGAASENIRKLSIEAFRGELERAIQIGAEYLIAHPGNYRGLSVERGILNVLEGVREAAHGLPTGKLVLLIENTVGAGTQLGGCLEELHVMREFAPKMTDLSIGFCLDTCHLLASGYDIAAEEGLRDTVAKIDRFLGLENVHVIHANDSKTPLGSHVDRHENIGEGHIGREGFRRILSHPALRNKAFILETPVDNEGDDKRNLETLKALSGKHARRN